jgi:hypothetical protein
VVCFHRSRPSPRRARNVTFTLGLGTADFQVVQALAPLVLAMLAMSARYSTLSKSGHCAPGQGAL